MDIGFVVALCIVVLAIVVVSWVVIAGYRRFGASAQNRLQQLCAEFDVGEGPAADAQCIVIDYHVYWGFLNTVTQAHVVWHVREADALRCLNALLRFNLSRGVWGAGAVYVPPLALYNYWRQRRRAVRALQQA